VKRNTIAALFFLTFLGAVSATAGDVITCTECGMKADLASRFTARASEGGKDVYFCDIGDLLTYMSRKKQPALRAQVKDYTSGAWLDADKALFVQAPRKFKSPMGWGIAAFRDARDGALYGPALDLAAAMKAVQ
jgi:hypothetical protein